MAAVRGRIGDTAADPLLAGASLMIRSFLKLQAAPSGVAEERLLTLRRATGGLPAAAFVRPGAVAELDDQRALGAGGEREAARVAARGAGSLGGGHRQLGPVVLPVVEVGDFEGGVALRAAVRVALAGAGGGHRSPLQ